MDRLTAQGQAFATSTAAMYDDRCTIRRISKTKGSDMGNKSVEQVLATKVPIKIKAASAFERQVAGATQGATAYRIRIPYWNGEEPLQLDSTCFLDIAARGRVEAQTLHVIAPLRGSGTGIDAVAERQS